MSKRTIRSLVAFRRSPATSSKVKRAASGSRCRCPRFESLEERALLSVTILREEFKAAEFTAEGGFSGSYWYEDGATGTYWGTGYGGGTLYFTSPDEGTGSGSGEASGIARDDDDGDELEFEGDLVVDHGTYRDGQLTLSVYADFLGLEEMLEIPATFNVSTFIAEASWDVSIPEEVITRVKGSWSGTVTTLPDELPDLFVASASWSHDGVEFEYQFAGRAIETPGHWTPVADVRLYWADGPDLGDIISSELVDPVPIYWNQASGAASASGLGAPPLEATHLLVVVDRGGSVEESNEYNNVKPLEIPKLHLSRLEAFNDFFIYPDDDPTIWTRGQGSTGDPIADWIKNWPGGGGWFNIRASVSGAPDPPPWQPEVCYSWSIPGTGKSGTGSFLGWQGTFTVPMPEAVGKYELRLRFAVLDPEQNVLDLQDTSHTLYATYGEPRLSYTYRKEAYLKAATEWTHGASTPESIVSLLNDEVYKHQGFDWLYRNNDNDWRQLLETTVDRGNCVTYSNMWNNLGKLLGIDGTKVEQTTGTCGHGFLSILDLTSLDLQSGNAHPPGGPVNDRWLFAMHQVGVFQERMYYDPTFGRGPIGSLEAFVEWNCISPMLTDPQGRSYYDLELAHRVYLFPGGPWGNHEYHSPGSPVDLSQVGAATFTGNYSVNRIDSDGDGVYNNVVVEAEVDVGAPGEYFVWGPLMHGDESITARSAVHSTIFSGVAFSVSEPGTTTVAMLYSGEDIYRTGIDGVLSAHLVVADANGIALDDEQFLTPAYQHDQFGELPLRIRTATDHAEDSDGNGRFDYLTTSVQLDVLQPGDYCFEATLYSAAGDLLSAALVEEHLADQGEAMVDLHLDGRKISAAQVGGPYQLVVAVLDDSGDQPGYVEIETSAYDHTDFDAFGERFSGAYADQGVDLDGNGRFDFLLFDVGLDIDTPGEYTVEGWIYDNEGKAIAVASSSAYLNAAVQSVTLEFNGTSIHKNQVDGPYYLKHLAISNSDWIDYVEDAAVTSVYSYGDFEVPLAARIQVSLVHQATAFDDQDTGERTVLPESVEWIDEWDSFWVEIWVSTPYADDTGVASATADLAYNTDYFTATGIEYGPAFTENQTGTIDDAAGVVDDLGTSTLQSNVGDDQYALLARVRFEPTVGDPGVPLDANGKYITPADQECALDDGQTTLVGYAVAEVRLADPPGTELWPVMYDVDDDGRISFGDLAFFAEAFQQKVGAPGAPFAWACDFDHSGRVDFGDLAFFAENFQCDPGSPIIYPDNFPDAWQAGTLAARGAAVSGGSAAFATVKQANRIEGMGAGAALSTPPDGTATAATTSARTANTDQELLRRAAVDLMLLERYASPGAWPVGTASKDNHVSASATAGRYDQACVYNSALPDDLKAIGNWAQLSCVDPSAGPDDLFTEELTGFELVKASPQNEADTKEIDPSAADWLVTPGWD